MSVWCGVVCTHFMRVRRIHTLFISALKSLLVSADYLHVARKTCETCVFRFDSGDLLNTNKYIKRQDFIKISEKAQLSFLYSFTFGFRKSTKP